MDSKPYRAFGYLVVMNRFFAGEDLNLPPVKDNRFTVGSDFPYVWMYTDGTVVSTNTATGEQKVRMAGDCTVTDPWPQGEWLVSNTNDYDVLCISADTNPTKNPPLPQVVPFVMKAGESRTVTKGTRLLLGEGQIDIEGVLAVGVRPIEFASGDKTVTAITDAYGLVFL